MNDPLSCSKSNNGTGAPRETTAVATPYWSTGQVGAREIVFGGGDQYRCARLTGWRRGLPESRSKAWMRVKNGMWPGGREGSRLPAGRLSHDPFVVRPLSRSSVGNVCRPHYATAKKARSLSSSPLFLAVSLSFTSSLALSLSLPPPSHLPSLPLFLSLPHSLYASLPPPNRSIRVGSYVRVCSMRVSRQPTYNIHRI